MPLLLVLVVVVSFSSMGSGVSALMVDVEVDLPPREFLRGPRWVSLNSVMRVSLLLRYCSHECLTFSQIPGHDAEIGDPLDQRVEDRKVIGDKERMASCMPNAE